MFEQSYKVCFNNFLSAVKALRWRAYNEFTVSRPLRAVAEGVGARAYPATPLALLTFLSIFHPYFSFWGTPDDLLEIRRLQL